MKTITIDEITYCNMMKTSILEIRHEIKQVKNGYYTISVGYEIAERINKIRLTGENDSDVIQRLINHSRKNNLN